MLFAFATTHFLNHALGHVDLKTMHKVEAWRKIVTRSVPGTIVLSGGPKGADVQELDQAGVEKAMAVMFLDLRDFTQLSQSRLPYDVVFILNEFFAAAGAAIHTHGGWIDKFLGRRPARRVRPASRRGGRLPAGSAGRTRYRPCAR